MNNEKLKLTENSSSEIDYSTMESQLRIILQMILETLSSIIQTDEEKTQIEKLIHDYKSLDELQKIIVNTLDVLLKKFFYLIENPKNPNESQSELKIEYLALEKQLQKFEQECREHIRNEQQLQIYSDSLFQKIEDLEKKYGDFNQDTITQKDEQIQELLKEKLKLTNQVNSLTNNLKKLEAEIIELKKSKNFNDSNIQELEQKLRMQDLLLQNFMPVKDMNQQQFPLSSKQKKSNSLQLLSKRQLNTKSHLNLQAQQLQDYSGLEQLERQTAHKFHENQLLINQQQQNEICSKKSIKQQKPLVKKNSLSVNQAYSSTDRRNQTEFQLQQYIGSQLPINPKFYNTKNQKHFTGQKNNLPLNLITQTSFLKQKPINSSLNFSQQQREGQNLPHVKDQISKIFRNNNNNNSNKKRNLKKQGINSNIGMVLKTKEFL